VEAARAHLALAGGRGGPQEIEPRVAASVTHLGLTARLLSPLLALAALSGAAPPARLAEARWQDVPGGLVPLSLPRARFAPGHVTPGEWADALLRGPLTEFTDAAAAPFRLSRHVLLGNTASAANGAAAMLAGAAPGAAADVRAFAAALTAHPALRGTADGTPGAPGFRRRGCCLIYRAAPPGTPRAVCGDCVLGGPGAPVRR
jgi:hypothetical protein